MKVRYLSVVFCAVLAITLLGCGKKEEEPAPTATTAPAATPIDPATAAVVMGEVKLDGPAPKAKPINMAAEPACNKEHGGKPVPTQEYIVGNGGALANVIVFVKEGLGNRTFDTPKEPVELDQKGCMYSPHVVALQVGQDFRVVNNDPTTHNIHPVPSVNREWNKSQPSGAVPINESFAREEIAIPVKCDVHPWMKSYIAVFRHPYHSVTGEDGKFELKNLPPGDYVLEAWHEKLGTAEEKVTLGPKESKTITFTFKAPAGD